MAAIDKLVEAFLTPPNEAVLLAPGRPPAVVREGVEEPAARTALAPEVVRRLVGEIAPPGLALDGDGWRFERAVGSRRILVEGRPGLDGPTVWIVRLDTTAADGPPSAARRGVEGPTVPRGSAKPVPAVAAAPDPAVSVAATSAPRASATRGPAGAEAPDPAVPAAAISCGPPAAVRPGAMHQLTSLEPLLAELLARGGSDLHLTSGEAPRLRLDGDLVPVRGYYPPTADELHRLLFAVTPPKNREEFDQRYDTDFGLQLGDRARFRANLFRDQLGVGAVFRRIPVDIPSAEDLRLPVSVQEMAALSKGLVLVTGPTGSGKSTTLAALIDLVNRTRADHIITIEDPVEFVHRSKRCLVHQREVGNHTASFAAALRAALREDPDVVLVGEMRDLETTRIAVETAETGHLVFGTLHTTSAAGTVERLINQYPEGEQAQIRLMLASSLKAVVAQTLLKKVGGGRVAAFEVLLATQAVSNLIREGKVFQLPSVMQTARGKGMLLLDDSLLALVREGLVTPEDAFRKANDKTELASRLRAAGADLSFLGEEEPTAVDESPRLRKVG